MTTFRKQVLSFSGQLRKKVVAFETLWLYSVVLCSFRRWKISYLPLRCSSYLSVTFCDRKCWCLCPEVCPDVCVLSVTWRLCLDVCVLTSVCWSLCPMSVPWSLCPDVCVLKSASWSLFPDVCVLKSVPWCLCPEVCAPIFVPWCVCPDVCVFYSINMAVAPDPLLYAVPFTSCYALSVLQASVCLRTNFPWHSVCIRTSQVSQSITASWSAISDLHKTTCRCHKPNTWVWRAVMFSTQAFTRFRGPSAS
jgi:hypothetical protein